mmetsp:Transcript_39672/g.46370  ORF Transcript_39672/g.46370 Transcript_39672/m.46370 type:complete len:584 (-) Transcript_39672:201-1952(-)
MALTTAEKNRRKRERKKRERLSATNVNSSDEVIKTPENGDEDTTKSQDETSKITPADAIEIEIEYVPEPLLGEDTTTNTAADENNNEDDDTMESMFKRFAARAGPINPTAVVSEDESPETTTNNPTSNSDDDNSMEESTVSKKKLRLQSRPTISKLKQTVSRPDLVEAHDVTAADPTLLLHLKSISNTVPVPRHWGRKRKYLQGKRGIEKIPYTLPDYILATGIKEIRGAVNEDDAKASLKQKQRGRVAPKGSGGDVDYRVLHDAFFKYQTLPPNLTHFGDLYYEGKEFEISRRDYTPGVLSDRLREALGLPDTGHPPTPWLINMQRYGPPPSYPNLKLPGLNAPLPLGASYGYHSSGWGKPPVDQFGRGLYGDVFGRPTVASNGLSGEAGLLTESGEGSQMVTSDGKQVGSALWGALPTGVVEEEEEEESDESEEEDMEESDEEEEVEEVETVTVPVPADGADSVVPSSAIDLRKKVTGEETPAPVGVAEPKKALYTVLEQTTVAASTDKPAMFASEVAYTLPTAPSITPAGDTSISLAGAESVLSKASMVHLQPDASKSNKRKLDDEEEDEDEALDKKFKF